MFPLLWSENEDICGEIKSSIMGMFKILLWFFLPGLIGAGGLPSICHCSTVKLERDHLDEKVFFVITCRDRVLFPA